MSMRIRIKNILVVLALIAASFAVPAICYYGMLLAEKTINHSIYSNCIFETSYYEPSLCEDTITIKRYYLTDHNPQLVISIGAQDSITFESASDMYTKLYRHQDSDTINVRNLPENSRRGAINYTLSERFKIIINSAYDYSQDNYADEYYNKKKVSTDFRFVLYDNICWVYYPDPTDPYRLLNRQAHRISKHRIRVRDH